MSKVLTAKNLSLIVIAAVIMGILAGTLVSVFDLPRNIVFPISTGALVGGLAAKIAVQSKSHSE